LWENEGLQREQKRKLVKMKIHPNVEVPFYSRTKKTVRQQVPTAYC